MLVDVVPSWAGNDVEGEETNDELCVGVAPAADVVDEEALPDEHDTTTVVAKVAHATSAGFHMNRMPQR